jgi:drug/metabolite transporter (DMT)-like permease
VNVIAPHADRRLFALGLRLIAVFSLATMLMLIKLASETGIKLLEILFWRQSVAIPVLLIWVLLGPGFGSLKTTRMKDHAVRMGLGLTGMVLNFGAVMLLPLAEAATIGFTIPIFATIVAALVLKEQVGRHRWSAVVAGFIGIVIVIQPGTAHFPLLGAAVGLAAAMMVVLISLQIRDLGRTETAITTVFWFSSLSMIPLCVVLPFVIAPHDGYQWRLLGGIGLAGAIGQVALTASLRFAPVSVVVGMDYSSLLWSTLYGWLIWEQLPGKSTWIGAPLIIASGLYIAWREHRLSIARAKESIL